MRWSKIGALEELAGTEGLAGAAAAEELGAFALPAPGGAGGGQRLEMSSLPGRSSRSSSVLPTAGAEDGVGRLGKGARGTAFGGGRLSLRDRSLSDVTVFLSADFGLAEWSLRDLSESAAAAAEDAAFGGTVALEGAGGNKGFTGGPEDLALETGLSATSVDIRDSVSVSGRMSVSPRSGVVGLSASMSGMLSSSSSMRK